MNSDHLRMLTTLGRGHAACLAASAEVGALALRSAAADQAEAAGSAADVLRAPATMRGAAAETALRGVYDAQLRQMRALRGASALWGMAALCHFDAMKRR